MNYQAKQALKCGLSAVCFIGAIAWGAVAFLHHSPTGIAACWIVAIVSICAAVNYANHQ